MFQADLRRKSKHTFWIQ